MTHAIGPVRQVFLHRAPETQTGDRWAWAKQSRHTSQMDRLRKRGEELALAAPARPSGRDGVMASPPPPRRRWLLEGAGAAFQHVLTPSTVTDDKAEHCPIVPYAYDPGLIARLFGVALEARERLRCKVIAYIKKTRIVCHPPNSHLSIL